MNTLVWSRIDENGLLEMSLRLAGHWWKLWSHFPASLNMLRVRCAYSRQGSQPPALLCDPVARGRKMWSNWPCPAEWTKPSQAALERKFNANVSGRFVYCKWNKVCHAHAGKIQPSGNTKKSSTFGISHYVVCHLYCQTLQHSALHHLLAAREACLTCMFVCITSLKGIFLTLWDFLSFAYWWTVDLLWIRRINTTLMSTQSFP